MVYLLHCHNVSKTFISPSGSVKAVNRVNFAFPENDPDYESTAKSNNQTIKTDKLEKGLWYVTVRCATTVNATEKYIDTTKKLGRFFVYSGNTDVLNGVPYNIVASW